MITDCLANIVDFGDWCLMPFSERNNYSYFRIGKICEIPSRSKSKSDYVYVSTDLLEFNDWLIPKSILLQKQFYHFGQNYKIVKIEPENVPKIIKDLYSTFVDNRELFSSPYLNIDYKHGIFTEVR